MYECVRDVRQAMRGLKKNPGTTAIIILALALGIGVNVSVFVFVKSVVLNPFPFSDLDRLMTVWESPAGQAGMRQSMAPANYFDFKERSRSFQHLGAYRYLDPILTGIGDPERIKGCTATPDFFYSLGINAEMGRIFREEEGSPERADVAVVSRGFWQRRLGGREDVLGTKLLLNGSAYTIVGVMPESFNYPLETEKELDLGPLPLGGGVGPCAGLQGVVHVTHEVHGRGGGKELELPLVGWLIRVLDLARVEKR